MLLSRWKEENVLNPTSYGWEFFMNELLYERDEWLMLSCTIVLNVLYHIALLYLGYRIIVALWCLMYKIIVASPLWYLTYRIMFTLYMVWDILNYGYTIVVNVQNNSCDSKDYDVPCRLVSSPWNGRRWI